MSTEIERLVLSRVIEKIQAIIDEESRQEDERILNGDGSKPNPMGILYSSAKVERGISPTP